MKVKKSEKEAHTDVLGQTPVAYVLNPSHRDFTTAGKGRERRTARWNWGEGGEGRGEKGGGLTPVFCVQISHHGSSSLAVN